jgi:hypothetical protein
MSPLIKNFNGIRIWFFGRDHCPPHIHAEYGEEMVIIEIEHGDILAGSIAAKKLRMVLEWLSKTENKKAAAGRFYEINPHLITTRRRAKNKKQKSKSGNHLPKTDSWKITSKNPTPPGPFQESFESTELIRKIYWCRCYSVPEKTGYWILTIS